MSALLLSLLLFSWCFIADGLISDTLRPLQNLTDGQTLVSSNRRFELGFFSPGNSSNRYLGIWYYNLPLTVVWVANKENPIANLLGRLTLNTAGDLFLYNQSTSTVWSTNHTFSPENPILQLLDTGNLVVRNGENSGDDFVWQSFDYISDTLLPGMKLGWNLKTGQNRFMTSWKSDNDPSTGEFTFSLDPPQSPQLVLRRGQEKTYRWGPFDGDRFSGIMRKPNAVYRPTYISNSDEVYFAFQVLDEMTLLRFTVTNLGLIRYYRWINDSKQWRMMFTRNRDYCDRYAMCGPYGACFSDDPNCRCLKGFTPRLPKEWSLMDQSSGCRRIHELNCSDRDGFLRYTRLKLPDNSIVLPNRSIEQCRSECLRKCECMAYTGVQAHGNGNGTQCVVWLDALIDIRDFPDGGEVIYIRMARPELESIASTKRRRLVLAIAIVIASIIFGVLLVAGVGCYIYRERKARMRRRKVPHDNDLYNECNNEKEEDDLKPPLFDFDAIFYATNKFSSENKIGHGGFGPVYKGVLPNGLKIAVKRLSQNSGQGLREFKNEVTLIAKLQHRNLVRLLGCCIHGKEKLLVYEYLPNRSLDNFIFDGTKQEGLPWNKRFNIIMGIARGLLYLHQDSRLIIIHRDLKTSNILLDGEMNPKISDFGMARIFRGDQTEEKTRRVVGTYGYMSPEYAMDGHFSVKSDVFSFGVLLLEIISGQKNWGFYHPDHDFNLLGHAWKLWNEKNQMEVIDKRMGSSFSLSEVMRCIQVGLLCVQQCPDDRPTMCSVVSMLSNEMVVLSEPKEPTFFTEISSRPCNGKTNITFNEITITTLDGR